MSLASMLFTLAAKAEPPPPEPPLVLYFGALAAACLVGAYITKQAGSASLSIGLGAAFAFSVLEALDLAVVKPNLGVSCFYPGHAPVTVILFAMPAAPAAATAFKVLGGHCAITATSYLLVAMKANLEMLAFASKVLTVGLGVRHEDGRRGPPAGGRLCPRLRRRLEGPDLCHRPAHRLRDPHRLPARLARAPGAGRRGQEEEVNE